MLVIAFVFLVSAHSLHSTHAAIAKHSLNESPIHYPESIEESVDDDTPEPCRELTYCTIKPKNYPEKIFNEILKVNKPRPPMPQPSVVIEINNRINNDEGEDGCMVEITNEPIYRVRSKRDEPWLDVVQAPQQGFIQRARIEKCKDLNASCFQIYTAVPGHVTFCHQKYSTFDILVAKDNNDTELIKAELPACCSCRYKKIDFMTRIGKP